MPHRKLTLFAIPLLFSGFPLQYFRPHGYHPMHISKLHIHGPYKPTSVQRDGEVGGNECVANSKLDIDEPVYSRRTDKKRNWFLFVVHDDDGRLIL